MSDSMRDAVLAAQDVTQRVAMGCVVLSALALGGYSLAAALGQVPWLEMTATFGDVAYPRAGMAVQLSVTALMLALCFYLPSNSRMLRLENSHRSFHIGMRDVTRAYSDAHSHDRQGAFTLRSEFDSVRERIEFLRQHPDLRDLESGVIEVAAQMSHIARELAHTYSDANVARARDYLVQRQQEIEDFNDRLADAKAINTELKRWYDRVELEESVARSQLDWLREELAGVMPEIFAPAVPEAAPEIAAPPEVSVPDVHIVRDHPDTPAALSDDQRIVELLQRRARH